MGDEYSDIFGEDFVKERIWNLLLYNTDDGTIY